MEILYMVYISYSQPDKAKIYIATCTYNRRLQLH